MRASFLYDRCFFHARLAAYAVLFATIVAALLAPLDYACNLPGHACPACGLRTAVTLALEGRFFESLRTSPFAVPLVTGVLVAIVDTTVGTAIRTGLIGRPYYPTTPSIATSVVSPASTSSSAGRSGAGTPDSSRTRS